MIRVYDPADRTADLFALAAPGTALLDPVDCTGAQGAGLAKAFARRWPHAAAWFKRRCREEGASLGRLHYYQEASQEPLLVFFPTKTHYAERSTIEAVQAGLFRLLAERAEGVGWWPNVGRVAIPALGCGEGELHWANVRSLIEGTAQELDQAGLEVHIFPPQSWRDRPGLARRRAQGGR